MIPINLSKPIALSILVFLTFNTPVIAFANSSAEVAPAPATSDENTIDDFHQVLQSLAETVELSAVLTGETEQQRMVGAFLGQLQQVGPGELEALLPDLPPLNELQTQLDDAQTVLEAAVLEGSAFSATAAPLFESGSGEIIFPEPDASIDACNNIPTEVGFSLLTSWQIVNDVLVAMKWGCIQTTLGENAAELCSPSNIATDLAKFGYKGAELCLKEQRDAYLNAILGTDENIANYLSDFADTTVESLATQDSVNTLQEEVTDANTKLSTLANTLSADFSSTESNLSVALDDLDSLTFNLNNLIAISDDIQFRSQVNQVDIEDAQLRAADVQESAEEIREETQALITSLSLLENSLQGIVADINSELTAQTQAALATALADASSNVIRFKAPAAAGGALEQAREIVIQAILAFTSLGADTSTAQALLVQGDQAYNQADYFNAYDFFAQAYQSLITVNTASAKSPIALIRSGQ